MEGEVGRGREGQG